MILGVVDGTSIEKLTNGSQKKIIFECDVCHDKVEQSYRNYLKQNNGKFCRTCRNTHTSNRPDVKKKISDNSTKMWLNPSHRKKMVEDGLISRAVKKSWNNGRKPINNIFVENTTKKRELIELVNGLGYEYINSYIRKNNGTCIKVKCKEGHITIKRLCSIRSGKILCVECCKHFSQAERDLSNYIKSLGFVVVENDRTIIKPLELDIVIPEKKIAIEYCGLFWHGETKGKHNKYHLNKLGKCESEGYRLITIFEDEWANKQDIVKSRLKYILGQGGRTVYARQCVVKEISPKIANTFINKYHLQGSTGSSIKLGLHHNGELIAVMTFAKPSISKGKKSFNDIYELSRFCSSCQVVGGASKLLSHFKKNYEWNEIFTFADLRWSEGNLYKQIGFNHTGETKPNYWYFNTQKLGVSRKHRFNYRKDRLPSLFGNVDMSMTEWQIMQSQGFDRIWDCGNLRYKITNNVIG
jgi:G:T-mismatch repair DNA endonuclease (very short patch repair protein)